MRLALALVLCALAAGCASKAGPDVAAGWQPDACDVSDAAAISQNAPAVVAMRGSDAEVARRFVEAFGDEWVSDAPTDPSEGARKWATREGEVRVTTHDTPRGLEGLTVDYTTPHGSAFDRESVAAAFERLGVAPASVRYEERSAGSGRFHQAFAGTLVIGTGGSWNAGRGDPAPYGSWAGLTASVLRDFSDARASVPLDEAKRVALAYDRCLLDREGKTEAAGYAREGEPQDGGFGVMHDSLVRLVAIRYTEPEESHCGLVRRVAVDAETGAAHGLVPFGCD